MKESDNLKLTSINGLAPEEYAAMQNAAENRVCKKNLKEHILYTVFVGVIMLLASTMFQYVLVAIIAVCGWISLWYSQNIPLGPDNGMPRTHGILPIFGLLLLLFPITAIGVSFVFIYTLIAQCVSAMQ